MNCLYRKSLFEETTRLNNYDKVFRLGTLRRNAEMLEILQYNSVEDYVQLPNELFHQDYVINPIKRNVYSRDIFSNALGTLNKCSRIYQTNDIDTIFNITKATMDHGNSGSIRRMFKYYDSDTHLNPNELNIVYSWDMQPESIERHYVNLIDAVMYHLTIRGSNLVDIKAIGIIATNKPNEMVLEGFAKNKLDTSKTTLLINKLDYPGFNSIAETFNKVGITTKIVEEELFTDFTSEHLKQISSNPMLITDEDLEFINQTFRN